MHITSVEQIDKAKILHDITNTETQKPHTQQIQRICNKAN